MEKVVQLVFIIWIGTDVCVLSCGRRKLTCLTW